MARLDSREVLPIERDHDLCSAPLGERDHARVGAAQGNSGGSTTGRAGVRRNALITYSHSDSEDTDITTGSTYPTTLPTTARAFSSNGDEFARCA